MGFENGSHSFLSDSTATESHAVDQSVATPAPCPPQSHKGRGGGRPLLFPPQNNPSLLLDTPRAQVAQVGTFTLYTTLRTTKLILYIVHHHVLTFVAGFLLHFRRLSRRARLAHVTMAPTSL